MIGSLRQTQPWTEAMSDSEVSRLKTCFGKGATLKKDLGTNCNTCTQGLGNTHIINTVGIAQGGLTFVLVRGVGVMTWGVAPGEGAASCQLGLSVFLKSQNFTLPSPAPAFNTQQESF